MVTFETDRLVIRDELEGDLHDMHRLWSDKETMRHLDVSTDSIEQTAEFLKIGMANADGHYFCVCHKATGAYMGNVGYTITAAEPKTVHMGYMFLPEYHGQGYAPEAVKKIVEFAFTKDACARIITGCSKQNGASRKVMEKAGFHKVSESDERWEYAISRGGAIDV